MKQKQPEKVAVSINSERYANGWGFRNNCQRVVYAFEMACRGHNVQAQERTERKNAKEIMFQIDDQGKRRWMNVFEGQEWTNTHTTGLKSRAEDDSQTLVSDIQKISGANSRGVVYMAWKGGDAHVFNYTVDANNNVSFHDAQNGQANFNVSEYMQDARRNMVMFSRVDNLQPRKAIEECITRQYNSDYATRPTEEKHKKVRR